MSARRTWDIVISCPRPKPRVSVQQQAWHLDPERVQKTIEVFFAPGTSLSLTSRTARLATAFSGEQLGYALDRMERTLGTLLHCLYFDTGRSVEKKLPGPVRFEIVERREQTPPTKGDQVT
ncbi:hypothetical protein ACH4TX_42080 [Streptomyces sp. NPDC021098]|uniref:hypothetical protein n=1 Tax=unclassified Streptomyces TaxID=2593676 RepID=UPI00378BF882